MSVWWVGAMIANARNAPRSLCIRRAKYLARIVPRAPRRGRHNACMTWQLYADLGRHIVCTAADSPNGLVGCACNTLPIPARTRWDATVGAYERTRAHAHDKATIYHDRMATMAMVGRSMGDVGRTSRLAIAVPKGIASLCAAANMTD